MTLSPIIMVNDFLLEIKAIKDVPGGITEPGGTITATILT